jgi:hypothetical protein
MILLLSIYVLASFIVMAVLAVAGLVCWAALR